MSAAPPAAVLRALQEHTERQRNLLPALRDIAADEAARAAQQAATAEKAAARVIAVEREVDALQAFLAAHIPEV